VSLIRSERSSAALLLGAAVLGLILANTALGPGLMDIQDTHLSIPALGLDLSVGHWISDGLLAVFFFIVAVELKHELVVGELSSVSKAIHPAIAAIGGVVVPALVYLALTAGGSDTRSYTQGWPVPTATDIAFALGVLAIFGKGLPNRLRVFLLALAVLDDLIAIVIIAVFFTSNPNLGMLGLSALTAAAFGLVSRMLRGRMRVPLGIVMVILGVLTWVLVHGSGVHATIAGVVLGLVMSRLPGRRVTHALEPWSNALVLPLFAFSAALVAIPQVPLSKLAAPFWGILIALPVGKLIGITLGGWLGSFVGRAGQKSGTPEKTKISLRGLIVIASLGGIGFTVSLLMNELAFSASPEVVDEGTLAVLLGSAISMVASGILVSSLARRYRREHPRPDH
jgi:Na+:H+ antiporter, NhaA family